MVITVVDFSPFLVFLFFHNGSNLIVSLKKYKKGEKIDLVTYVVEKVWGKFDPK